VVNKSTAQFKTFEDLEVYQAAREFRKTMYGVTRQLPAHETFELAGQIRRAAVSLTNNIAEGPGRYHYLDQIRFALQARGSLQGLIDDLNVCEDEQYLAQAIGTDFKRQGSRVCRLVKGYIRYLRERKTGSTLGWHESSPAYGVSGEDPDAVLEPV
jgi:four helix bundle protein